MSAVEPEPVFQESDFADHEFENQVETFDTKSVLANREKFSGEGAKIIQQRRKDYYDYLTKYKWHNPATGEVEEIPVPLRWHPVGVFKRILQHNKIGQYTGIVEIGMSGSGKTTLTRMMLHRFHEMGEHYIVKWFTGQDMLDIDKIINSCIEGMPHVLVFDDASYTLEDAKKTDIARLANALTTIRHKIKSRVITVMNIHYSKATKKFFRNQHFTFLTSVSTEEMGNYADLFKHKMNVVDKFAKMYNKLMLHGYFDIPLSSRTYDILRMKTNEPFRVGLVAEISDLHFVLYARESCNICDPETDHNKLKDWHKLLDDLKEKYNNHTLRTMLGYMAAIYEGEDHFEPNIKAMWRHLASIQKVVKIPWGEMLSELRAERKRQPHKKKKVSSVAARDQTVMDVVKGYQEQLNSQGKSSDVIAPPIPGPNLSDLESRPISATKKEGEYDSLYIKKK